MAAVNAQGTELWLIDPTDGTLIDTGCVNSIDGLSAPNDDIETTCLRDTARCYEAGLATPGTATMEIQFDPRNADHVRLHRAYLSGRNAKWALGMSDATGTPPTVKDGNFELPETRSWLAFEARVQDFPFSFAQNTKVTSGLPLRLSGKVAVIPATK